MDISTYDQRVKLRLYNCKVNIFTTVSDRDAASVLVRTMPALGVEDHRALALKFEIAAAQSESAYEEALNAAFQRRYGRAPSILDYKISCIWDESLSDSDKQALREHGYAKGKFRRIARAHAAAVKHLGLSRQHRRLAS